MFVGIDVAKAELVVSVLPTAERFTVANDDRGLRTLVDRMRVLGPPRNSRGLIASGGAR
jgi:hypothetical protein